MPRRFHWQRVKTPQTAILDLSSAKVATFVDDRESWPTAGNLVLHGFVYEQMAAHDRRRIDWLKLQREFQPQPYEQLAIALRKMGREGDAAEVMIAKNKEYTRHTSLLSASWWWYNLFGRMVGYGYNPWRPFLVSLLVIGLGTVLSAFGWQRNLLLPTDDTVYSFDSGGALEVKKSYPIFNSFVYSLETFVPLLKLGMDESWRPHANRETELHLGSVHVSITGSLLRGYFWLHIIAGWILTTLWVGGLTGIAKT